MIQIGSEMFPELKDTLDQVGSLVGTANDFLESKTKTVGQELIVSEGSNGLNLSNYGVDAVRYNGAVGGDLVINANLTYGNSNIENPVVSISNSGYTNNIDSGSVIGGVGGSAAIGLAQVNASVAGILDYETNGSASATINGDINTIVGENANLIGFTNGGMAIGIGTASISDEATSSEVPLTTTSTVTGDTILTIDGTDRVIFNSNEKPGADDIVPQLTTALNVMKGSGINAIGVTGGGTALTTLGGTAESNVSGTTTINVNNATVLGAIGGGIAGAVDATLIGDKITGNPVGNDNGNSGFGINYQNGKFDIVTGPGEDEALVQVDLTQVNQGGTAYAKTGNTATYIAGESSAAGVFGGGIAASTHTYVGKEGENKDKIIGNATATSETGRSQIVINLDGNVANLPDDRDWVKGNPKYDLFTSLQTFADKISKLGTDDDQNNIGAGDLKDFANKGAAIGIFGGGIALANGSTAAMNDSVKNEGAVAKAITAGSDILLQKGYVAGVMGGGVAGAVNNATAMTDMTDTVNIFVEDETEAVGLFGNGLAYFTGSSEGGTKNLTGLAKATAQDTNFYVNGGSVDGIIGGGMAIDDSQADYTNAIAKTEGTATINVNGGTVNKVNALQALTGVFSTGKVDTPNLGAYVDGVNAAASNAAIAAGGIALGGGAEAYVENAQVNVVGGKVQGDVYAGGIAAFGHKDSDTKGSHVQNATINLGDDAIVYGNIFAGGAVATKTSSKNTLEDTAYANAKATVENTTINLAGAKITGVLSGSGTVDKEEAVSDNVKVGTSILYLIGENTLSLPAKVDKGATVNTNSKIHYFTEVNATAGSVTKAEGLTANVADEKVLFSDTKLNVADGAYLDISNISANEAGVQADETYHIAKNMNENSTYWNEDALMYDRMAGLYATTGVQYGQDGKESYDITFKAITEENAGEAAQSMSNVLDAGPINPLLEAGMLYGWKNMPEGAQEYFDDWQKNPNMNAAFGRGMMIGEDSAVTGNTVSVARDVADEVAQHLSFTEDFVQDHDSIYGDDNIWAKYIHNKFETDGMSSSFGGITADNDYNGVIVGYDFNQSGKLQSGVAIHYGNGSGTGSFSRNDYDAWGVSLYGALKDEEAGTNLMADIGYTKTTNDISGTIAGKDLTADRDLTAWTIGVRGEKEFVSGKNQIVPYVGLRYMNVDPSSYTSYYNGKKAFAYDADKQDIWMVPLGVSFRNETKTGSGWRITPKLDVAYIWAFGDTDNSVDVNMAGASAPLYYTVMDDGSWLASLGVDASHGAWTFGAGYAYQKGDDTKNNKWYVNAGFAF